VRWFVPPGEGGAIISSGTEIIGMQGKRILLGVSGGIAAYKSPDLVRRLRERGAEVQVVMTAAAREFVTAATFQAVSGLPVRSDLWDPAAEAAMGHIELARWADAVLVAPASADFLARLAGGHADDLLATLCLASAAPIAVAPAMNHLMWANPATRANVALLAQRGIHILGPGEGDQACGESGPGRMLEPADLSARLQALLGGSGVLAGKRVLITAGPTRERIDPVRFISNRSSGKMGFAVAQAAREAGASVVLVSGPVSLPTPAGVMRLDVESAADMLAAVLRELPGTDVFISTAAVADYRPTCAAEQKIKKTSETLDLAMERTTDVLATVAARNERPFVVGFAAETEAVEQNARAKLMKKNLDLIAANEVGHDKAFDCEDNQLVVLARNARHELPRADKLQLARGLIALIAAEMGTRSGTRQRGSALA
jgi:phosphopantothenoylcysteine decarboxylase/phosphopantothenate--cysteine ligase